MDPSGYVDLSQGAKTVVFCRTFETSGLQIETPNQAPTIAKPGRITRFLYETGLPAGLCNILSGYGAPAGQAIDQSEDMDMVAFARSTRVSKMAIQASSGNIKKRPLELGGKSSFIVFADCDINVAIDGVLKAVSVNMGECCIAGARVLLQDSIAESFQSRLATRLNDLKVGNPFDSASRIGAIISSTTV